MSHLQDKMQQELRSKAIFDQARTFAYRYIDQVASMPVFPPQENIDPLEEFVEPLPEETQSAMEVLQQLQRLGGPATVAQTAGRYFGFVNGGAVPASLAVKWLADVWDQCGGLYLTSPLNAKLEEVCQSWLRELFDLPQSTVAGFVSGTSMANLSALAAARFQLLKNQGWDINEQGLNGAPALKIYAHAQVHASVKKTLAMLGFGRQNISVLPADEQGRIVVSELPKLDNSSLVLLQAGNVNTGAYDDFYSVCTIARQAGAWVHIDGAFGLWARATKSLAHLTKGMELADSWAVDGHKTLNTPYDCGIVLCRDEEALLSALQATGEYLIYGHGRDPILYGPEMSKRSRAIELWATMKYLGKAGIDSMVSGFNQHARQLGVGLQEQGYELLNEVVFNQVLIAGRDESHTRRILEYVQQSGELWCGGTTWQGQAAIRISVCSWVTNEEDIRRVLLTFQQAFDQ